MNNYRHIKDQHQQKSCGEHGVWARARAAHLYWLQADALDQRIHVQVLNTTGGQALLDGDSGERVLHMLIFGQVAGGAGKVLHLAKFERIPGEPYVSVNLFGAHLRVEFLALRVAGVGINAHAVLGASVVLGVCLAGQIIFIALRQTLIVRDNNNSSFLPELLGHEKFRQKHEASHDRGREQRGNDEALGADAVQILAPGDEIYVPQDLTHLISPPPR